LSAAALVPLSVLALLLAVPIIAGSRRAGRRAAAWTAAGAMLTALLLLVPLVPEVMAGEAIVFRQPWLPAFGLDLTFRIDGFGALFALLILGIGLLIVLYAAYYLPDDDPLTRFYALLLTFAAGMLGLVLSENVLLLLAFWEITSLASFALIAYKSYAHDARIAARMALAVTGGGGLALLAGLLVLGSIVGSFELSVILASGDMIRAHSLYPLALVLILLGAFTKSAQFPFHFWLPNAMAAPTPVSAYLHSATMVKAGVFLLGRLYPALSGTELWFAIVSLTGAFTFVYGAYMALLKHDFKGLLAYSTISHLGLITLLFGLDTPNTAVAAVFHIVNHAIFKASLFMAAGIIDHECGTRDMRRIHGLFKYMPWTGALAIVAAGSMAGVPLLNGFLSKEMFFAETIDHPAFGGFAMVLPVFATIAGILSVAYSARFVHDVFFGNEVPDLPREPREPPLWLRLPVEVLVALVLLVGLFPQFTLGALLAIASRAVLEGPVPEYTLAIWHGFDLPLLMSAIALVGGVLHYWKRQHLFALHERFAPKISSRVAFERVYRAAAQTSAALLRRADGASLQRYLAVLVAFAIAIGAFGFVTDLPESLTGPLAAARPGLAGLLGLAALGIGAVGAAFHHRRRIVAVVFISIVGLVVSMTFVYFSAPDLALTQLSVEVVTIVLLLLALRFLPGEAPREPDRSRLVRDGALAAAGGAGMAALAYAMLTRPYETISGFHLDNAVPGGGGTNAVNVILVDFRGFDTLGEIAVLAMAAIALHAVLDGLRLPPHARRTSQDSNRHPIMLAMLMRPLLPLALTVSVYVLLRGHNLPGGGFIAGLIAAVALMLQYLASGIEFASARMRIDYVKMLAAGLAIATATGVASWAFGYPFLTSAHAHLHAGPLGEVEAASAMIFDIGVFIVVVAAVLLALSELGQLSVREIRPHESATSARRERRDAPSEGSGRWR
jgi:multicomponent K+:H+ antiporter subunit A